MATTYKLIDKAILTSNQSSVTFTSIDNSYTDLVVLATARSGYGTDTNDQLWLRFNSDTGNNYGNVGMLGTGSAAYPNGASGISRIPAQVCTSASTSDTFNNNLYYIPNYNSSNYKSVSIDSTMEQNGTLSYMELLAGIWNSTSAITSINFTVWRGTNILAGSSFYLYGIKNS